MHIARKGKMLLHPEAHTHPQKNPSLMLGVMKRTVMKLSGICMASYILMSLSSTHLWWKSSTWMCCGHKETRDWGPFQTLLLKFAMLPFSGNCPELERDAQEWPWPFLIHRLRLLGHFHRLALFSLFLSKSQTESCPNKPQMGKEQLCPCRSQTTSRCLRLP